MEDLTIRAATAADAARVAEVLFGDPGDQAVGLVGGSREKAIRFGKQMFALDPMPNPDRPIVVALDGETIVGVLQYSFGRDDLRVDWARAKVALRVLGLTGTLWLVPRLKALERVVIAPPLEAFYIAELHVDPTRRGQGIGGRLLDWADGEARSLGRLHMALSTTATNPSRRLYERKGYKVTQERNDAKYERYTGIPGRIMMEKTLSG